MNERNDPIDEEILAYLADRPDGQDTVEGIAEWWLLEHFVRRGVREVREALDDLVERGLAVEVRSPDSQVRYQVNREQLLQIREALDRAGKKRRQEDGDDPPTT